MTERKPEGLSWQSWIDRQILEGQSTGAFDRLAGHGQPLDDIGVVHDELWWVKAKLRAEDLEYLPPTIAIRAERAAAIEAALAAPDEARARLLIEDVNTRIRYINSHGASGPPSTTVAIDIEAFVDRWRVMHTPVHDVDVWVESIVSPPAETARWWRRLVRWSAKRSQSVRSS